MQAAGDLVPAAAELAAGVQLGEDELDGADALGGVHVGGDAAPVVLDPDGAVLHEDDVDGVGVARERLVDRVVDDLPDEVVQPALAGGADVHARALAHGLEALEDGDRAGVVGRALDGDRGRPRGSARGPGSVAGAGSSAGTSGVSGWSATGLLRRGRTGHRRVRAAHGARPRGRGTPVGALSLSILPVATDAAPAGRPVAPVFPVHRVGRRLPTRAPAPQRR